ncbi:MAG: hypothetical protein Terrestrivirus1_219 [Terrestrivirus sp.]|uniref:Uncharacterized protein n=1 Tax=Terrestrivirus sp. TaxID=2487775 RepID=A0A3G4ZKH7_9VIRU|nr:MAG: hypothetical protein Terrestrivirus1_219 [Terrestrivirus sp.]
MSYLITKFYKLKIENAYIKRSFLYNSIYVSKLL